ncbi:MAG TPA: TlpA disulfide reductase family protein [Verrucomicrobiae bacterium]|nr:TlpA disulfide reductase family protein [Verrucomicrobiae bacterium]
MLSQYATATTFHLEYTRESRMEGESLKHWTRTVTIAMVSVENQYHFELRGEGGGAVQISDGKTEWVYSPGLNQYAQRATPGTGPTVLRTLASTGLQRLTEPQTAAKSLASLGHSIRTAKFAPDEQLQVGNKAVTCIVVISEAMLPGSGSPISRTITYWIDEESGLIRREKIRMEGELLSTDPGSNYVSEDDRVYSVAKLNVMSFPEGAFVFTPRVTAALVKEFEEKQSQELAKFVGQALPTIKVKGSDGRDATLQSFRGKPLLLDFWASWCVPCREALPDLERLYQENKEKGLVLLSLDQDEVPQKADDFWIQQKMPWPNYHIEQESLDRLPSHGIPFLVLIDSSGKVVFSHAGLDEKELRAAVASLWSPITSP